MKKVYLNTPEEVIKALKDGKEIFLEEGGAGKVKLIDGLFVKEWNDQFNINYTINLRDKPYILEEEPLKIEVGKFYRTRRGDKVVCLCHRGDYYIHRLNSYIVGYWVYKTGRALFNGVPERTETDSDVVALWED